MNNEESKIKIKSTYVEPPWASCHSFRHSTDSHRSYRSFPLLASPTTFALAARFPHSFDLTRDSANRYIILLFLLSNYWLLCRKPFLIRSNVRSDSRPYRPPQIHQILLVGTSDIYIRRTRIDSSSSEGHLFNNKKTSNMDKRQAEIDLRK